MKVDCSRRIPWISNAIKMGSKSCGAFRQTESSLLGSIRGKTPDWRRFVPGSCHSPSVVGIDFRIKQLKIASMVSECWVKGSYNLVNDLVESILNSACWTKLVRWCWHLFSSNYFSLPSVSPGYPLIRQRLLYQNKDISDRQLPLIITWVLIWWKARRLPWHSCISKLTKMLLKHCQTQHDYNSP